MSTHLLRPGILNTEEATRLLDVVPTKGKAPELPKKNWSWRQPNCVAVLDASSYKKGEAMNDEDQKFLDKIMSRGDMGIVIIAGAFHDNETPLNAKAFLESIADQSYEVIVTEKKVDEVVEVTGDLVKEIYNSQKKWELVNYDSNDNTHLKETFFKKYTETFKFQDFLPFGKKDLAYWVRISAGRCTPKCKGFSLSVFSFRPGLGAEEFKTGTVGLCKGKPRI